MNMKKINILTWVIILFVAIVNLRAKSLQGDLKFTNAKSVYAEIIYSDSSTFRIPINNLTSSISKSDLYTKVNITSKDEDCGKELMISLKELKSKKIKFMDIVIKFTPQFSDSNLVFYNNATITNAWVMVMKPDKKGTISRELVLFKNKKSGKSLNIAFTTFNRFFTYFKTYDHKVVIRECMQDRILKKNKNYRLESILLDEILPGDKFFEKYTSLVKRNYHIKIKPIPAGWSSWSCYYGNINEKKLMPDAKAMAKGFEKQGADIFQLDAGWYGKSWGDWIPLKTKFKQGIAKFSERLEKVGLKLGLWYAPTMFEPQSDLFHNHFDYNIFYNGKIKKSFGGTINGNITGIDSSAFYPLDLSNPEVNKYIYNLFNTAVNKYKSKYFKLDFLVCSLLRQADKSMSDNLITFPKGDYSVAVYRKTMMTIRKAVGDSIFLNACGAPIGESVGIFNGSRISPDIIWEKGVKDAPAWWTIFKDDARNIFLRSYFNNKFFVNDPDALVIRDYNNGSDYVKLSDNQAKFWATVVGMSGGTIFLNENMNKLSAKRKRIYEQVLPVWGKAAHPLDFFEQPYPTVTHIEVNDAAVPTQIVAIYNFTDSTINKSISLRKLGLGNNIIAVDCWNKSIIGNLHNNIAVNKMPANSVRVFLLKDRPEVPSFLFMDSNIYMGADRVKDKYSAAEKKLILEINTEGLKSVTGLYIYIPAKLKLKNHSSKDVVWRDALGEIIKNNLHKGTKQSVYIFE